MLSKLITASFASTFLLLPRSCLASTLLQRVKDTFRCNASTPPSHDPFLKEILHQPVFEPDSTWMLNYSRCRVCVCVAAVASVSVQMWINAGRLCVDVCVILNQTDNEGFQEFSATTMRRKEIFINNLTFICTSAYSHTRNVWFVFSLAALFLPCQTWLRQSHHIYCCQYIITDRID